MDSKYLAVWQDVMSTVLVTKLGITEFEARTQLRVVTPATEEQGVEAAYKLYSMHSPTDFEKMWDELYSREFIKINPLLNFDGMRDGESPRIQIGRKAYLGMRDDLSMCIVDETANLVYCEGRDAIMKMLDVLKSTDAFEAVIITHAMVMPLKDCIPETLLVANLINNHREVFDTFCAKVLNFKQIGHTIDFYEKKLHVVPDKKPFRTFPMLGEPKGDDTQYYGEFVVYKDAIAFRRPNSNDAIGFEIKQRDKRVRKATFSVYLTMLGFFMGLYNGYQSYVMQDSQDTTKVPDKYRNTIDLTNKYGFNNMTDVSIYIWDNI